MCRCHNSHLTIDNLENIGRMTVGISRYASQQGDDAIFLTEFGEEICRLTVSTTSTETNYHVSNFCIKYCVYSFRQQLAWTKRVRQSHGPNKNYFC